MSPSGPPLRDRRVEIMVVLPVGASGAARGVVRAAPRGGACRYFSTVKPCSSPYFTEASCHALRPSSSRVPEM